MRPRNERFMRDSYSYGGQIVGREIDISAIGDYADTTDHELHDLTVYTHKELQTLSNRCEQLEIQLHNVTEGYKQMCDTAKKLAECLRQLTQICSSHDDIELDLLNQVVELKEQFKKLRGDSDEADTYE